MWVTNESAQRQPARVHLQHLVDAAARRIHFRAQRAIGRALVQAQAAMHALGVQLPRRLLARREVRDRIIDGMGLRSSEEKPPAIQNVFRIERVLHGPHAVEMSRRLRPGRTLCRTSCGQCRTAMLASRGSRLRNAETALMKSGVASRRRPGHKPASR